MEGIWNEPHWGMVGIVKEGSVYQRYNIRISSFKREQFKGGWWEEEKAIMEEELKIL